MSPVLHFLPLKLEGCRKDSFCKTRAVMAVFTQRSNNVLPICTPSPRNWRGAGGVFFANPISAGHLPSEEQQCVAQLHSPLWKLWVPVV